MASVIVSLNEFLLAKQQCGPKSFGDISVEDSKSLILYLFLMLGVSLLLFLDFKFSRTTLFIFERLDGKL